MQRSLLIPMGGKSAKLPVSPTQKSLPAINISQDNVESLMEIGNKKVEVERKLPKFEERDAALPLNSQISKVYPSESTAVFETFEGVVQDQSIEEKLLNSEFLPTEKILTRDEEGNVICHFIKVRDKLGHAAYVELDCDYEDGMGFIEVSPNDTILHHSHEASVVPYSLKVGTFEANSDLYGVGFECNNSVCVMSRKDASLAPSESVFSFSKNTEGNMGILENHITPFPIVKMSEVLSNPKAVSKNISEGHRRMRNVAFSSCMKDVEQLKKNSQDLQSEIANFDKNAAEISKVISSTLQKLENLHCQYERNGIRCPEDSQKLKTLRFNLQKRNDLQLDFVSLCRSMKERSEKVAALKDELSSLNGFMKTLFAGLNSVFTE